MSIDNNLWRQLSIWGKLLIIAVLFLSISGNTFLSYREQILGIQPGQEEYWAKWIIVSLAIIQFIMTVAFLSLSPSDKHSLNEVRSYLSVELRRESAFNLGDDIQPPRGTLVKGDDDFKPLLAAVGYHLIEIMNEDNDDEIRGFAARHLGAIGEKRALSSLIKLLRSETADLQNQVVWSLGELQSRKATKPLCKLLLRSGTPIDIILTIAQALEKIDDPQAIRSLETVLTIHEFLDLEKELISKSINSLKNSRTPRH